MNKDDGSFEISQEELEQVRKDVWEQLVVEKAIMSMSRKLRDPKVRTLHCVRGNTHIGIYKLKTKEQVDKVDAFVKKIFEESESFDLNE